MHPTSSTTAESSFYTRLQEVLAFDKNLQSLADKPETISRELVKKLRKTFHSLVFDSTSLRSHVHYHLIEANLEETKRRIESLLQSQQHTLHSEVSPIFALKKLASLYHAKEHQLAKDVYETLSTDIQELLHANIEKILASKACHAVGLAAFERANEVICEKDLALAVEMLLTPSLILSELSCMALARRHTEMLMIINDLPPLVQDSIYIEAYNYNASNIFAAVQTGRELFQNQESLTPKARSEALSRASAFYEQKEKKVQEEIDNTLSTLQKAQQQQLLSSQDLSSLKEREYVNCIKKVVKIIVPHFSRKIANIQDSKTLISYLMCEEPLFAMHSILFILDPSNASPIKSTVMPAASAVARVAPPRIQHSKEDPISSEVLDTLPIVLSPPKEHQFLVKQALTTIREVEGLIKEKDQIFSSSSPLILAIIHQELIKQQALVTALKSNLKQANAQDLADYIETRIIAEMDPFLALLKDATDISKEKEIQSLSDSIFSKDKQRIIQKIYDIYPKRFEASLLHDNLLQNYQGSHEEKEELIATLMLLCSLGSQISTLRCLGPLENLPKKAKKISIEKLLFLAESLSSLSIAENPIKNYLTAQSKKTDPLLSEISQKYYVLESYEIIIKTFKKEALKNKEKQ